MVTVIVGTFTAKSRLDKTEVYALRYVSSHDYIMLDARMMVTAHRITIARVASRWVKYGEQSQCSGIQWSTEVHRWSSDRFQVDH